MVLPAGREARLPPFRRRLCRDRRDVEAELKRIGHTLSPLEIVVVNTSAGAAYGQPDYVAKGCGMGREATLYLLERGVRVTGTDGWSWDAPFVYTMKKYAETHDASLIWEGHRAGREIGYCHIEKLHNLEALPAKGFTVSCFPVKMRGGSAGWTRAVAIIDCLICPPCRAIAIPPTMNKSRPNAGQKSTIPGEDIMDRRQFVAGSAAAAAALAFRPAFAAGRLSVARHHPDQSVSAGRRRRRGRPARSPRCSSRSSSSRW